ncbi:MAG: hypothetical protein EVA88_00655 [Rhodospirillaceae bacterium]|nr:MAG: hypothetical protein EVA88_00655 [Rhodospirillaceae bacterium]
MQKSANVSRRSALRAGVSGMLALGVSAGLALVSVPGTALAQSDEDPAQIILRIADDAFNLFGSLNGRSRDWGSRRAWTRDVARLRFATRNMAERAGGAFLREFNDTQLEAYFALTEQAASEFLLDIFSVYEPNTTFVVDRVRRNRTDTATIMESTVIAQGKTYRVDWTVIDDGGVLKVSNVSIFGLNLVSDFRASFRDAFRHNGAKGVLSMLDTRIKRSERKFPG